MTKRMTPKKVAQQMRRDQRKMMQLQVNFLRSLQQMPMRLRARFMWQIAMRRLVLDQSSHQKWVGILLIAVVSVSAFVLTAVLGAEIMWRAVR